MGWTPLGETAWSGVWLFWGALQGEGVLSALLAAGDWVRKGSHRTAWSVPTTFFVSLLGFVWARHSCPWCAEGDVPTAANLNLFRKRNSREVWQIHDEPLFGQCGEAKLIDSVSFGIRALFKWNGKSCSEAGSCCGSNNMLPPVLFLGQG